MNAPVLPAVVGELVALVERYISDGELQSFESRERFRKEARATLSALTAEAGKGERDAFEAWITAPPIEANVSRFGPQASWPDQYRDYAVQLAWDSWQAARLALSTATHAGEWREIESAPRTGIAVLLWQPWKSGRDCTVIGHYANGWSDRDCEEMQPEPTHWQPLPAPPLAASPRGASESGNG